MKKNLKTERFERVNLAWSNCYIDDTDGVVLWKGNDEIPKLEVLDEFLAFGYISQLSFDNSVAEVA